MIERTRGLTVRESPYLFDITPSTRWEETYFPGGVVMSHFLNHRLAERVVAAKETKCHDESHS